MTSLLFTRDFLRGSQNVTMLAPMVKCGTLPLRLLALEYGADVVYTEELIAHKLRKCARVVNAALGTVDFVCGDELVLRTCNAERRACIVQIGAADADVAVDAVRVIADDFGAVDLNMGCPKHFSVQGGMGAALLKDGGVRAAQILSALIAAFPHLSISCKVRLLATVDDTVALIRRLEATGVWCVAVHAREAHERPVDRAHWSTVRQLLDAGRFDVPLVINGDVFEREHIALARAKSGCSAVMVARGALRNASLFGATPRTHEQFWRDYTRKALEWDASTANLKYTLIRMLSETPRLRDDEGARHAAIMAQLRVAKTTLQICEALNMVDELKAIEAARANKRIDVVAATTTDTAAAAADDDDKDDTAATSEAKKKRSL